VNFLSNVHCAIADSGIRSQSWAASWLSLANDCGLFRYNVHMLKAREGLERIEERHMGPRTGFST
jgi:hypothetical protein